MKAIYETKTKLLTTNFDPSLSPTPHLHKELELIYVYEGSAVAVVDKKCYTLNPGDLFIAFPNQIHYYLNSVIGKYCVLIALPDIVFGLKNTINSKVPECCVVSGNTYPLVKEIFEKMLECNSKYSDTVICGYLNLIFGEILPELKLTTAKHGNPAIASILDYCSKNFAEVLDLDKISKELHLSRYYISHLLNKHLNLNFNDYINRLRIKEACELLILTDKKVADISEEIGFGTIRSFNRAFKSIMLMTPGEYRKLQREE